MLVVLICKFKLPTDYLYPLIPILCKVTYPVPEPHNEEFCEPVNKSSPQQIKRIQYCSSTKALLHRLKQTGKSGNISLQKISA